MRPIVKIAIVAAGILPGGVAYAAMLGLGLHRHAPPWVISLSATLLVFGPPLVAAAMAPRGRMPLFGCLMGLWSLGILSAIPVYFPGERARAVVTGMSVVSAVPAWENVAQAVAHTLPLEPQLAEPELPAATALVEQALPPAAPLEPGQIALPYEGAGRRLSVPVTFEQGGRFIEREMMLDTGATYTTLPLSVLEQLGAKPLPEHPTIVLHTANGEREAQVVLIDSLWLGDLQIRGVAVATCEACASPDTVGLLGLNVSGNFNLMIDADRREVVFTTRESQNRRLDVTPFTELSASLSRYPGGRMEVEVQLQNRADRAIPAASAEIRCDESSWTVDFPEGVAARAETSVRRRLPDHEACERYQVALLSANW